jgi:hypothetical protein
MFHVPTHPRRFPHAAAIPATPRAVQDPPEDEEEDEDGDDEE